MMKKLLFLLFLFLLLSPAVIIAEEPEQGFFRWTLALVDKKENVVPLEAKKITPEVFNQELKIFFCPQYNAWLYLMLSGPGDSFALLFPAQFKDFNGKYETEIFYPSPGSIERPGAYTLYIIIAASRQKDLEELVAAYREQQEGEKADIKEKILSVIRALTRSIDLKSSRKPAFEKEAGTIREGDTIHTKLKKMSERIDFNGFFIEAVYIEKK